MLEVHNMISELGGEVGHESAKLTQTWLVETSSPQQKQSSKQANTKQALQKT